ESAAPASVVGGAAPPGSGTSPVREGRKRRRSPAARSASTTRLTTVLATSRSVVRLPPAIETSPAAEVKTSSSRDTAEGDIVALPRGATRGRRPVNALTTSPG